LTAEEFERLVTGLGDLVRTLRDADAAARQGVPNPGRLVYVPQKREIRAEATLDPDRIIKRPRIGGTVRVRGASLPATPHEITATTTWPVRAVA
jgi:hypothetical protein